MNKPIHIVNFFTQKEYFALYNKLPNKPGMQSMQEFINSVNAQVEKRINSGEKDITINDINIESLSV